MFSKIKQFLPGSSRSLHAMHSDLNQVHNELEQIRIELGRLYERVEIADPRHKRQHRLQVRSSSHCPKSNNYPTTSVHMTLI